MSLSNTKQVNSLQKMIGHLTYQVRHCNRLMEIFMPKVTFKSTNLETWLSCNRFYEENTTWEQPKCRGDECAWFKAHKCMRFSISTCSFMSFLMLFFTLRSSSRGDWAYFKNLLFQRIESVYRIHWSFLKSWYDSPNQVSYFCLLQFWPHTDAHYHLHAIAVHLNSHYVFPAC